MIDVLSVSRKPVIISHANSRTVHDHPRNVDDEVLELLRSNGGVIGVTMIPETIGKEPTIDSLIRHIIHIRNSFGSRILALGTDYLGIESTPIGLENVSRIGRLIEGLVRAGLSDDEIRGLMFENALRVIRANLTG
jgi:membrane dipeptidase